MAFGLIAMVATFGCTSNPSSAGKSSESKAPETVDQKAVETQKKAIAARPYIGRWTLDHNAYRASAAFQALKPKQQRAAVSMLNKLQTDMTIGDDFIDKIGRFNERQVVTKLKYVVAGRKGEVWMVDVKDKGKTWQEEWRMSQKHLVINVNGKDRVYARVGELDKPNTTPAPSSTQNP